jgi:hypothetical protein
MGLLLLDAGDAAYRHTHTDVQHGLAINWYGDSLDDMLARVRNAQSPICGFAKFCEVS